MLESKTILTDGLSNVHGFDFTYQGVLGIWEGLQPIPLPPSALPSSVDISGPTASLEMPSKNAQNGNFQMAINALNSSRGLDKASWKPAVHTSRAAQRRLAHALCGWNVGDDELQRYVLSYVLTGLSVKLTMWQMGKEWRALASCMLATIYQSAC